ncbi:MAG: hypothetical protein V3S26_04280 [Acidimicrobiia bacterium]
MGVDPLGCYSGVRPVLGVRHRRFNKLMEMIDLPSYRKGRPFLLGLRESLEIIVYLG